jgi:hypothetical protein
MTTSFSPRGNAVTIARKAETAFGSAPSGNWTLANIYKHTLAEKQPFVEDPLLGQVRANNRDPLAPAPGLPVLSGDIDVPLDLGQLGYWLSDLFGAPTTTGSSPNFIHTWNSGSETLPSAAMETKLNTSLFLQHLGLTATKASFNVQPQSGYDMMTVSYTGSIENKITTSAAGTPSAIVSRIPLAKTLGTVKIDSTVVGSLLSFKGDYDNGIKPGLFVGSGRPQLMDLDGTPSFKGTASFRFRDSTFYDMAKPSGTNVVPDAHTLECLWQISSNLSLSIKLNAARIEPDGVPISGPDGLQWSGSIRAEQTASLAMLTTVLKTTTASF